MNPVRSREIPLMRRWIKLGAVTGALLLGLAIAAGAVCRFTPLECRPTEKPGIFEGLAGLGLGRTVLPPGFRQEIVARGLSFPSACAFLPDGRILVAEKKGLIRVVSRGRLLRRPLVDLRARVSDYAYRGLLAVEPDPRFRANGYLYVLYVVRRGPGETPTTVRVSRIATRSARRRETVVAGGIPCDRVHCGGDLAFAPDGSLLISTGDGWTGDPGFNRRALRAQSLNSLAGKLLRITPAGRGLPDNPFWDGDAGSKASRIWAYGLRNPFRFTLRPGDATPIVGDVGWNRWEEIDAVARGANLGWPCFEGPERPPEYAEHPVCRALYARGPGAVQRAVVAYHRGSVTGGAFYTGRAYPPEYRGAYFYGDWSRSTLSYLRFAGRGATTHGFATLAAGPVQIEMGPDGNLYYVALNAGELRRIVYAPRSGS
jgi:glucose/arabinose dehydrogenase